MKEDHTLLLVVSSLVGALSAEIAKLYDEIRSIRAHQNSDALHLLQQDTDADRHAAEQLKAIAELTNAGDTSKPH